MLIKSYKEAFLTQKACKPVAYWGIMYFCNLEGKIRDWGQPAALKNNPARYLPIAFLFDISVNFFSTAMMLKILLIKIDNN